jgi:hypothetical protein
MPSSLRIKGFKDSEVLLGPIESLATPLWELRLVEGSVLGIDVYPTKTFHHLSSNSVLAIRDYSTTSFLITCFWAPFVQC